MGGARQKQLVAQRARCKVIHKCLRSRVLNPYLVEALVAAYDVFQG
jgi:hypothetical protein